MAITVSDTPWAKESGHWYHPNGEPAYTIVGKNGKTRPTTLRDARQLGLLPSVTTITGLAARPGLERWKAEQVLMAGLTLPRGAGESESAWIGRVWDDSRQQTKNAAERGVAIHAAIESYYAGTKYPEALKPWVDAAADGIRTAFGDQLWRAEKSFADRLLGYGGKVDLHSDGVVLDIKGRDGEPSEWEPYDENIMQTAAYRVGLGLGGARCGVVFVSRTVPVARVCEFSADDLLRGEMMFGALMMYWKAKNRVRP